MREVAVPCDCRVGSRVIASSLVVALRFEGRSTRDFHDLFAYSEDMVGRWQRRGFGLVRYGYLLAVVYIEDVVMTGRTPN